MSTLAVVGAVVGATVAVYLLFPEAVKSAFQTIRMARQLVFGVAAVIVALVLIGTGSPALMLVGAFGVAYGVLWILVDEPHESIAGLLP